MPDEVARRKRNGGVDYHRIDHDEGVDGDRTKQYGVNREDSHVSEDDKFKLGGRGVALEGDDVLSTARQAYNT